MGGDHKNGYVDVPKLSVVSKRGNPKTRTVITLTNTLLFRLRMVTYYLIENSHFYYIVDSRARKRKSVLVDSRKRKKVLVDS